MSKITDYRKVFRYFITNTIKLNYNFFILLLTNDMIGCIILIVRLSKRVFVYQKT